MQSVIFSHFFYKGFAIMSKILEQPLLVLKQKSKLSLQPFVVVQTLWLKELFNFLEIIPYPVESEMKRSIPIWCINYEAGAGSLLA